MSTSIGAKAASAASQPAGRNSMFSDGYLKVLGFFDQRDREWYEGVHAPDFLSFAGPYLARYARNWITGARLGEQPDFSVMTEIHFVDAAAQARVRELMATPAAGPLLEHTMEQRASRGIVDELPPPGMGLFPAVPQPDMEHPKDSPANRQAVLLRTTHGRAREAFEAAARVVAGELASLGGGMTVAMDLLGQTADHKPADAVIYVANAGDRELPFAGRPELELVSILDVETVSSTVGDEP